ncbi:hypothetical protein I4F81_010270 [Pyropia yezoensis]|uniref:Uncharacterized protein n=1 Tax=Pyropia yezoensis TaxID=2788 RepID=A0ACC3CCR0_PYRYE|nr:hypothetical protein I4F81_010270 [Neopyropia yezoensis]
MASARASRGAPSAVAAPPLPSTEAPTVWELTRHFPDLDASVVQAVLEAHAYDMDAAYVAVCDMIAEADVPPSPPAAPSLLAVASAAPSAPAARSPEASPPSTPPPAAPSPPAAATSGSSGGLPPPRADAAALMVASELADAVGAALQATELEPTTDLARLGRRLRRYELGTDGLDVRWESVPPADLPVIVAALTLAATGAMATDPSSALGVLGTRLRAYAWGGEREQQLAGPIATTSPPPVTVEAMVGVLAVVSADKDAWAAVPDDTPTTAAAVLGAVSAAAAHAAEGNALVAATAEVLAEQTRLFDSAEGEDAGRAELALLEMFPVDDVSFLAPTGTWSPAVLSPSRSGAGGGGGGGGGLGGRRSRGSSRGGSPGRVGRQQALADALAEAVAESSAPSPLRAADRRRAADAAEMAAVVAGGGVASPVGGGRFVDKHAFPPAAARHRAVAEAAEVERARLAHLVGLTHSRAHAEASTAAAAAASSAIAAMRSVLATDARWAAAPEVDCHGMSVAVATAVVDAKVAAVRAASRASGGGSRPVYVVTGRGNHSGGRSRLRPALGRLLDSLGVAWAVDRHGGALILNIGS